MLWTNDKCTSIYFELWIKGSLLLECDDSTYGSNCIYSCGHCQDEVPCDKKTGKCPSGCASDYEGIYCSKSKLQEYSANLWACKSFE